MRGKSVLVFVFLGFSFLFMGCNSQNYRQEEGMVWNTLYHITYSSERDLNDSILTIFNEIDSSLSPFNPNSTVSKINENRSDTIDLHIKRVYEASKTLNSQSSGIFDPTLAPLIRAWGFGQGHQVSADTLRIDSLLLFVGIDKTELSDNRLIKQDPNIEFNFSAIAKGYGVDCVADMLERNGVADYLVEIGGEIRAKGVNASGKLWRIGIDRPVNNAFPGEAVVDIAIENKGLATSGNYRNFHESNGKKFGHTISPLTGRPVESDVISATVVAPTCMQADAVATCCMALGSKEALQLCNNLNLGVLLILSDMSVITNPLFPETTSSK